jgi:MFS family permease
VFAVLADVSMNPDPTALPGGDVLQQLTNGIGSWALIAALIGMIVGAAVWALGHYSQNYQQSYNGRKGLLASGAAALVIGAAPSVVNFLMSLGQTVKK